MNSAAIEKESTNSAGTVIDVPLLAGPTVKFELSVSLASLNIVTDVWIKVAQKILSVLTADVGKMFASLDELRREIIIAIADSRARIRVGKLIAVAKVYEEAKIEIRNVIWTDEDGKQRLIERIDRLMDIHLEEIIQYS